MSVSNNSGQFKQIYFNEHNGKLFILDSKNNHYHCNLYGEKKPKFLPNITGFSTYKERVEEHKQNLNLNNTLDKSLYRPQHKRFEGYFQFPRPLSQPFFGEQFKKEENEKLLKLLEETNRLNVPNKNKHLLELKSNKGLHYFTSSLSLTDDTSKIKFIESIDKYIEEFREENKYKLDVLLKDKKIKALQKLKKIMMSNFGDNVIFGRHLPSPDKQISERFIINSRLMKKRLPKLESNSIASGNENKNSVSVLHMNVMNRSDNSFFNINSKTNMNFFTKSYYDNTDRDDLSFLSNLSEEKESCGKIKKRVTIEKECAIEKKLLSGYKPIIEKEKGIITKSVAKFLKSAGQLYNENISLLKKVNPIAFKKEEKKNKLYDEVLKKKKQTKMVTQKNMGF